MKQPVSSLEAPAAVGPYSQAIKTENIIFTSGQLAIEDGKIISKEIAVQTRQVMKNLKAVLTEAGVGFDQVVKTTIYVTDMADYAQVNQIYDSYLNEPYPARETVAVKQLPLGAKVEISMIASSHLL